MTGERLFGLFRAELELHAATLRAGFETFDRAGALAAETELLEATTALRGALRVAGPQGIEALPAAIEACLTAEAPLRDGLRELLAEALDLLVRTGQAPSGAVARELTPEAERLAAELGDFLPNAQATARAGGPAVPGTTMELFALECETHALTLSEGFLLLEREPQHTDLFDKLMRSAHCIKGAARVVSLEPVVGLAHAVEDHLTRARREERELAGEEVEALLQAADALAEIGARREIGDARALGVLAGKIRALGSGGALVSREPAAAHVRAPSPLPLRAAAPDRSASEDDRVLRVRASQVSRMVGLSGEALVEASRVKPLLDSQHRLRVRQLALADLVNDLHQTLGAPGVDHPVGVRLLELRSRIEECRSLLAGLQQGLEEHAHRAEDLTLRLHREAAGSRMRPLSDGLQGFPRMVRNVARKLGKKVELVVVGDEAVIDRDILEKIESPLTHVLRNAIDHGIERPEVRHAAGKPESGTLRLEARPLAGTLSTDRMQRIGFVVERLLGELDLLVRPLDARLGRVADMSAAAILPDGEPVLDVDDMIRSLSRQLQVMRIESFAASTVPPRRTRRVLVADDSVSVRELERRLLADRGYDVEVVSDGHAAWSMVRDREFDLAVLDIDMPRMDGLAVTRSIKQDARLRHLPVMLVSYRDAHGDRERGLEAGASAYLSKSEFRDDAFLAVVAGLIGGAQREPAGSAEGRP